VIAPQQVMKTLGADILRLWVAATDYRAEMRISDEILKRIADSYRRIRNTARYLLANLHGFDPAQRLPVAEMLALDRWAVNEAQVLQSEIIAAYDSFDFHLIYQKLHQFCVVEMGSFYLDVLKDRVYTMQAGSRGRRSAQTAMYYIAESMVRWLAPILSFTAEEIWHCLPGKRGASVFLEAWYDAWPKATGLDGAMDAGFWGRVLAVREAVGKELEKLRVAGGIGSSLDAEVDLYCDEQWYNELNKLDDELRFIFICSYARVRTMAERSAEAMDTEIKGVSMAVYPSGYEKCIRCWHHRKDVGSVKDHPQICGRCVENAVAGGEIRRYV
jgi:isoleucyl-tRNA synthetase